MTPEDIARQGIDRKLLAAGWTLQDLANFNPRASLGVDQNSSDKVSKLPQFTATILDALRFQAKKQVMLVNRQKRLETFHQILLALRFLLPFPCIVLVKVIDQFFSQQFLGDAQCDPLPGNVCKTLPSLRCVCK